MVEPVEPVHVRHVEVGIAVAVVVAPRHALAEPDVVDARGDRDVDERAVALVPEQLTRRVHARVGLVADVEIHVAVVVVVGPAAGLRRVARLGEPRVERDVGEAPLAVVPQQRVRVLPLAPQPRAAQHERVDVAVVVVVGLAHVQAAGDAEEVRRLGRVLERAVALVPEELRLADRVGGGDQEVDPVVAVEVVGHDAAVQAERVEPERGRDVLEARERLLGLEHARRDAVGRGHALGILAEGHVRDVHQPARAQVLAARALEHLGEVAHRLLRAARLAVHAAAADREEAALGRVLAAAVLGLAEAHVRDREAVGDLGRLRVREVARERGQERVRSFPLCDRLLLVPEARLRVGERDAAAQALARRRVGGQGVELGPRVPRAARADVEVLLLRALAHLAQRGEHALVARARGGARRVVARARRRGGGEEQEEREAAHPRDRTRGRQVSLGRSVPSARSARGGTVAETRGVCEHARADAPLPFPGPRGLRGGGGFLRVQRGVLRSASPRPARRRHRRARPRDAGAAVAGRRLFHARDHAGRRRPARPRRGRRPRPLPRARAAAGERRARDREPPAAAGIRRALRRREQRIRSRFGGDVRTGPRSRRRGQRRRRRRVRDELRLGPLLEERRRRSLRGRERGRRLRRRVVGHLRVVRRRRRRRIPRPLRRELRALRPGQALHGPERPDGVLRPALVQRLPGPAVAQPRRRDVRGDHGAGGHRAAAGVGARHGARRRRRGPDAGRPRRRVRRERRAGEPAVGQQGRPALRGRGDPARRRAERARPGRGEHGRRDRRRERGRRARPVRHAPLEGEQPALLRHERAAVPRLHRGVRPLAPRPRQDGLRLRVPRRRARRRPRPRGRERRRAPPAAGGRRAPGLLGGLRRAQPALPQRTARLASSRPRARPPRSRRRSRSAAGSRSATSTPTATSTSSSRTTTTRCARTATTRRRPARTGRSCAC